ncbi:9951_t:CDS:2 [Cetraspora pellucida]|uniref:9951_t:CDS:1 n=1 Tax=Cetraspora pellucida TaxID=1433469 RepID=A0ACA9KKS6_9GLOM|nr:9951_t:CDS:2 [Cetraspora pellucida]
MIDESEYSQALKSEYEAKIEIEPEQTEPHNGKKITQLVLSQNGKYAATWSKDDQSICGWQLKDQPIEQSEQSAEQSENESFQPKPFKKDVVRGYISDKEKIMLLEKCGSLGQWNLNTLLFEKQYQLDTNHLYGNKGWHCIFNKNSTLLAVYLEEFIYVYLTDTSMLLSQCQVKECLLELEFISPDEGERLLLLCDNNKLKIKDPYDLQHVINDKTISDLCDEILYESALTKLGVQKAEFKKLIDEKMYYVSDGLLLVQEISKKQWIKYLRENLKDYNKIRAQPIKSQIVKILHLVLIKNKGGLVNGSYFGSLVKWEVSNGREINAFLKNFSLGIWEPMDSIKLNEQFDNELPKDIRFKIYSCNLLHNEDLAIITSFGLLIWSIWQKYNKIRLRYIIRWIGISEIEAVLLLDKLRKYENNSLPAPDFDFIIVNCEKAYAEKRYFFDELLNDYIEDNILGIRK